LVALLPASPASAAGNAGYTTFDAVQDGCLDSPNGIDCNNYATKGDVYMNGGPTGGNGLADGDYYFTVLTPGSQNGGFVYGANGNLSDNVVGGTTGDAGSGDLDACRTFHVSGGLIDSYSTGCDHGTGTSPNGKFIIQLSPYDDTDNPGGVYILAICEVGATSPSQCKYDAFRIAAGQFEGFFDLAVVKNATPSFNRSYTWHITKDVDKTLVKGVGGTATFNYTVTVSHDPAADSGWQVTGVITVLNPNSFPVSGVNVTDSINDANASCAVTGGSNVTIGAFSASSFSYTCTYSAAPASNSETNTATATWPDFGSPNTSASFDVPFSFDTGSAGNPTVIDNCVTVVDDNFTPLNPGDDTTLGTACVGDPGDPTFTFNYSRTVPIPQFGCVSYTNTATFTTNTTGTTGSASQTVTVCGPARTGALTMGFWQNKNGQKIISTGHATSGVCDSGTWLRTFNPFQDLSPTATCSQVATYVYNVVKAATCGGLKCNAMLKAQDLATSLDVYFSDPALGGNKINAPGPIGNIQIDLTQICNMIDGGGGSATCSGTFSNASSAFGGNTCLFVYKLSEATDILRYAASQSNVGGTTWYANVKATQVLAKNTFDAINNQVAFAC
jgi:hypothetical protein